MAMRQIYPQPCETVKEAALRDEREAVVVVPLFGLGDGLLFNEHGGAHGARHRRHHVASSCPVARVGHDRQMAEFLDHGDRRDVERVARRVGSGCELQNIVLM